MDTEITAGSSPNSDNVCYIATIQSFYPDNVNTAEVLHIGEPCVVADVYHIICDRRNFKTVLVGPHKNSYTVQEIRNMSVHEQVGNGARPSNAVFVGEASPRVEGIWVDDVMGIDVPAQVPIPPTPETTHEPAAYQGIWQQMQNVAPVNGTLDLTEIQESLYRITRERQAAERQARPTLAQINEMAEGMQQVRLREAYTRILGHEVSEVIQAPLMPVEYFYNLP